MAENYQVKLDKFSGPLEKLLELIEARELEITLVNLATVTGDFLSYLKSLDEQMKHPSVLADFVVIASRLLLIKSKAILPSLELTEEEETDIWDLESRLRIYKEFKAASVNLDSLWKKKNWAWGGELFSSLPPVFYPSHNLNLEALEKHLSELIQELKKLIPEQQSVRRVVITIESKVKELLDRFKGRANQSFKSLSQDKPKIEIIMLFLAILHLLRDRIVQAQQDGQFSDIMVKKSEEPAGETSNQ